MTNEQLLIKNLRREWALQKQHCRLLEEQGRALLACHRARYMALQDEHLTLLVQLQTQEQERQTLMQDADGHPCTLSALLEQHPDRSRRQLEPLRDGLKHTLETAQRLSRRNEGLIQNELKYIAFMLDLYVEAGRSAEASYGGGGGRRLLLDRRA